MASVTEVYSDDDQVVISDIADDPIVTDPVAPKALEWAGEGFSFTSWIFECGNRSQGISETFGDLRVQFPQGTLCLGVELNSPVHSISSRILESTGASWSPRSRSA